VSAFGPVMMINGDGVADVDGSMLQMDSRPG